MDLVVSFPTTSTGHDAVKVIVDRLSKRARFTPTSTRVSALYMAKLFCSLYQRLHGLPNFIVSDRDAKFTSKLWAGILELEDSELHLSTAFRPYTDGQSEVTNKFIIEYLRHYLEPHQTDWDTYLPMGEFAYGGICL